MYKVRIYTHLDVVFQDNYFYNIQNTNVLILGSYISFMDNELLISDGASGLLLRLI